MGPVQKNPIEAMQYGKCLAPSLVDQHPVRTMYSVVHNMLDTFKSRISHKWDNMNLFEDIQSMISWDLGGCGKSGIKINMLHYNSEWEPFSG